MNKETQIPEGFTGVDSQGYYIEDEYGKWRSLDIQDSILTYLKPKLRIKTSEEVVENEKIRTSSGRSSGRYSWPGSYRGNRSSG